MGQLSISVQLPGRPCLVVGGGDVARRKTRALLRGGARVTVVAPELSPDFPVGPGLTVHRRAFAPADAQGHDLVFACTDSREVNAAVAAAAREAGAWVNVADDPAASTFFVNATLRRGDLTIGIGTAGASPALARRIREELEGRYGAAYEPFVAILGRLREDVVAAEPDPARRRELFARLAAVPCESILADGGEAALEAALRVIIADAEARV